MVNKSMRKKVPTQADVARLAGVSRPMVSYVLNNPVSVSISADTRQRILEAIDELGYKPDRVAQSLRTRKTYTIAAVVPDITNPFYPTVQRGIQDVARKHNYAVITYNTDGLLEEELHCLDWLQQGRVDGVIGSFFHLGAADFRQMIERNINIVSMGAAPFVVDDLPIDCVYVDNVRAARTAVEYLISRGHTRIGMIAGQASPPGDTRIQGYRNALMAHHIPLDEILVHGRDFTENGGHQAMTELLSLSPRPTAVFASNDLLAIGALMAIREAGLRVPQDIALIGCDDIPAAKLVTPALTTINQFTEDIGQCAATMLFERLTSGIRGLRNQEMPFELIIRGSA